MGQFQPGVRKMVMVYYQCGDQNEALRDLHRQFQRRAPAWRSPGFSGPIPRLGITIAAIELDKREHHWWEDRLREREWLGIEIQRWEMALRAAVWIEEHHPCGLRQYLTETHA